MINIELCSFCDFNQDSHDYQIELYEQTSYAYEGKKYFLEVQNPEDYNAKKWAIPREVFYCPVCGRKLCQE